MAFPVILGLVFFLGVPLMLRFKPLFEAAGAEDSQPEVKGGCD